MRRLRAAHALEHVQQLEAHRRLELRAVARNLDLAVGVPRVTQAARAVERQARRAQPLDPERPAADVVVGRCWSQWGCGGNGGGSSSSSSTVFMRVVITGLDDVPTGPDVAIVVVATARRSDVSIAKRLGLPEYGAACRVVNHLAARGVLSGRSRNGFGVVRVLGAVRTRRP